MNEKQGSQFTSLDSNDLSNGEQPRESIRSSQRVKVNLKETMTKLEKELKVIAVKGKQELIEEKKNDVLFFNKFFKGINSSRRQDEVEKRKQEFNTQASLKLKIKTSAQEQKPDPS